MRTIRLIAQDVTARWPVVQDTKPKTVGTVKKASANLLVKRCGFCKRLVITMNEDRDMTLFLVLCLVVLRKLVRGCDPASESWRRSLSSSFRCHGAAVCR